MEPKRSYHSLWLIGIFLLGVQGVTSCKHPSDKTLNSSSYYDGASPPDNLPKHQPDNSGYYQGASGDISSIGNEDELGLKGAGPIANDSEMSSAGQDVCYAGHDAHDPLQKLFQFSGHVQCGPYCSQSKSLLSQRKQGPYDYINQRNFSTTASAGHCAGFTRVQQSFRYLAVWNQGPNPDNCSKRNAEVGTPCYELYTKIIDEIVTAPHKVREIPGMSSLHEMSQSQPLLSYLNQKIKQSQSIVDSGPYTSHGMVSLTDLVKGGFYPYLIVNEDRHAILGTGVAKKNIGNKMREVVCVNNSNNYPPREGDQCQNFIYENQQGKMVEHSATFGDRLQPYIKTNGPDIHRVNRYKQALAEYCETTLRRNGKCM